MQREIFDKLKRNDFLRGLPAKQYAMELAMLSGDLNALQPFREGNGRAIRAFLVQLSEHAGYLLLLDKTSPADLLAADIKAFHGNFSSLATLYEHIAEPIDLGEAP